MLFVFTVASPLQTSEMENEARMLDVVQAYKKYLKVGNHAEEERVSQLATEQCKSHVLKVIDSGSEGSTAHL